MNPKHYARRIFLQKSALAIGAAALPKWAAFAATSTQYTRVEWQNFKNTSHYSSLLNAISAMRANTNASDKNSWSYWSNAHYNYCPHGIPYFLAWHRGFLYYFEKQLRTISGDSNLVLPYWNYYSYAQMPAEFTDSSTGNPLYVSRVNTDVYNALTMAPFASTIINFPNGSSNAFEPTYESAPHDPVHDIIGGVMGSMHSPSDPIFWLHHCNTDRLWVAWFAAGGGRNMPSKTSSYWNGSFTYSSIQSIQRRYTYDTTTNLYYTYDNKYMPTGLPPTVQREPHIIRVQASSVGTPALPPIVNFQQNAAHNTSDSTYSLGGVLNVGLDEHSISAQLPISSESSKVIQTIASGNSASVAGSATQYKSVLIVLDDLQMTPSGAQGGYYYKIYLNLPPAGDTAAPAEAQLIGTLGPFKISGAAHHGDRPMLRYVITKTLVGLSASQIASLTLSFIRINGKNSPQGPAIGIGEARVELTTEDVQS